MTGEIADYDATRGGSIVIARDGHQRRVRFDAGDVTGTPAVGAIVEFEIVTRPSGAPRARNIRLVSGAPTDTGVLIEWRRGGYGFIRTDASGRALFVHQSAIEAGEALAPGARVTFRVEPGPRGPRAAGVRRMAP